MPKKISFFEHLKIYCYIIKLTLKKQKRTYDVVSKDYDSGLWNKPFETIDLNAPGGIKDYMARYGSIFIEMAKSQTKIPDWSENAGKKLELERRKVLSEDDLEKRAKKRNFLLKQLRKLKIENDEI